RFHGRLEAADAGAVYGQREEDVGVAEHVVVEEVARGGMEVAEVEIPAAQRDGESELVCLIALAAKWQKSKALGRCKIEERARDGRERRRLIEAVVRRARNPVQPWKHDGGADGRAGSRFGDRTGEACDANSTVKRQPVGGVKLVFEKDGFQIAVRDVALLERSGGAVVGDESEERVVVL